MDVNQLFEWLVATSFILGTLYLVVLPCFRILSSVFIRTLYIVFLPCFRILSSLFIRPKKPQHPPPLKVTSKKVISDNYKYSNSPISWSPPPPMCHKININATGPVNNKWGIGAVVRGSDGYVAAAANWCVETLSDSDIAEAVGLGLTLQFALDFYFYDIMIESESLNMVHDFHKQTNNLSYFRTVLADCNLLSSCFSFFRLNHVRRSANVAAHVLAKSALTSGTDSIWFEDCPPCIASFVAVDLAA